MKKLLLAMALLISSQSQAATVHCRNDVTGVVGLRANYCMKGETNLDKALPTDSIFAPTSFWYQRIDTAPIDVNSENWKDEFLRQKAKYYGNVKVNVYDYAAPVHVVDSTVNPVAVGFYNCQNKTYFDATFKSMISAVPIPNYAKAAVGTDGELAFYKPSTGEYWELWKARKDIDGNWTACWGGRIASTKTNAGVFYKNYGTTATSLPFIGGQITAEELARGEIKHAIGIALVDLDASWVVSYPATRSDGYNPTKIANRIAEGQRFRLDPSINVDSLNMTKAGKTIAKAAQKYGFVVWDRAGSISIRVQNAATYIAIGKSDPYPALFESKPTYAVLNGFPWERLQFMPMNYGKP